MKTGIFAKNVQKRLNRAQEKVRSGAGELLGRGGGGMKSTAAVLGVRERMRLRSPPAPAAAASPVRARGAPGGGRGRRPDYVTDPFHPSAAPAPAGRCSPSAGLRRYGRCRRHLPQAPGGRCSLALEAARGCPRGRHRSAPGVAAMLPRPARGTRVRFASPHRPPPALLRGLPFL